MSSVHVDGFPSFRKTRNRRTTLQFTLNAQRIGMGSDEQDSLDEAEEGQCNALLEEVLSDERPQVSLACIWAEVL